MLDELKESLEAFVHFARALRGDEKSEAQNGGLFEVVDPIELKRTEAYALDGATSTLANFLESNEHELWN